MYFLWASGSIHTWFVFIAFTSFGFIGAVFGVTLTAQYGALVNGITNTFRKVIKLNHFQLVIYIHSNKPLKISFFPLFSYGW